MPAGPCSPHTGGARISVWIKVPYTLLVCAIVPVYWRDYGPANFLWFSDIALLATVAALWLESRLLTSMMAVPVLLPELAWNVSFFGRLIFGIEVTGLSYYMFDPQTPFYLRALSLFHVPLPLLLLWMVYCLGYDRRALIAQTLLAWVVLPVTYFVSDPADNINWVFGAGRDPQHRMHPLVYLGSLMMLFPLVVYLPTHLILSKLFGVDEQR